MTKTHDLHAFTSQVTDEMASEYDRIYANAASDPGTAGDEGEENWAALLREWLPPNYHVRTKGRLIATDGTLSQQIDVLVLKPAYPKKLLEKKVWLAGGVAAVFECKTTLTAAHVKDSISRCAAFKSLIKPRLGTPRHELRSPLIYGVLAHSHSWKGAASKPVDNINNAITGTENPSHPHLLLDMLCVADLGFWSSMYVARYDASWLDPEGATAAVKQFGGAWGATTSMICATVSQTQPMQESTFKPIGGLIGYITQRLAWEDASVRDIADYYRLAKLWGSGAGPQMMWPCSVYSAEVQAQIKNGKLSNSGATWDDWTIAGI